MIGIYKITSPSGKVYIGQSWNIKHRWADYGPKTTKSQRQLSFSFVKYGKRNHKFDVIHELPEDVDQETMNRYEQIYMDAYRNCGIHLLNSREAGSKGKPSRESIELMRSKLIGRIAWNKGLKGIVKMSEETKLKQSLAKKGKPPNNMGISRSKSAIERQKIKVTGLKRSPDQRQRMSIANIGKPYHGKNNGKVRTAEMNKRQSEIQKARTNNKGEFHCMAKVTSEQVLEIRSKFIPRKYTSRQLAKEYNLSKTNILDIVNRKIWTHI